MTAQELINKLSELDPDTKVGIVSHPESNYFEEITLLNKALSTKHGHLYFEPDSISRGSTWELWKNSNDFEKVIVLT